MESAVGDCGVLHKPEVVDCPGEICSRDVWEGYREETTRKLKPLNIRKEGIRREGASMPRLKRDHAEFT